jgi:preprotein translocase subunit SecY
MIESFKRIFSLPDLRAKIVFTLLLLAACRIGSYIPVPGINTDLAMNLFKNAAGGSQNLFQMMDMFTGGAFIRMKVCALGIMPYISSSIIMQLLTAIVPSIQREVKENPETGKRKIARWTRYGTVILACMQALFYAKYLMRLNLTAPGLIVDPLVHATFLGMPWLFYLTVMITMTAGTLFLMWIGDQITEKGIGNGTSLIITIGIVAVLPSTIGSIVQQLNLESQEEGAMSFTTVIVLTALFALITIGTILITQGLRKVPIQYARRTQVGQPNASYIPLKVNNAGVIPVIFASSLLMFPATIGQMMPASSWLAQVSNYLNPGSWTYTIVYAILILLFTYFWTATQFHPEQVASDMKKNGAFIPGIRQGNPTQEYLENTMGKMTLIGGVLLALIAILPVVIGKLLTVDWRISHFFGGTSLLILVSVVLDTTKQIESHLLMKKYDGFMKRTRKYSTN